MVEEGGWKTSTNLVLRLIVNLLAVAVIIALVGYYLGLCAYGVGRAVADLGLPETLVAIDGNACLQWVLAAIAIASITYVLRVVGEEKVKTTQAWVLKVVPAILVAIVCSAPLVSRLESVPLLRSPAWVADHWVALAIGLGALLLVNVVVFVLGLRFRRAGSLQQLGRLGSSLFTLRLVQVVGLLVISWFSVKVNQEFQADDASLVWASIFFAPFVGGPLVYYYIDRASPHLKYRDLLVRCFSVIRTGNTVSRPRHQHRILLSSLRPPSVGTAGSFPELLICAAVNISDPGQTPAGSNALSVVFTPKEMKIPADDGASLPISVLEEVEMPTRFLSGWGPAVNLSSVVAMTGAAVSPAMGKRTRNDLRALFAILNIRLGVWLPNPLSASLREKVEEGKYPKEGGTHLRAGLPGLIREMFGFHPERSAHVYVTDGGHYDNLGLVELLRRNCTEIWCVDASGDRPGRATALAEAILTAAGELGARVEIDLDRFARVEGSSAIAPDVHATHACGRVYYANGDEGTITVVKLGINPNSPTELKEYRRGDRPFPYHSTVNQIYRADRFDAYRALGWASANEALDDPESAYLTPGRRAAPAG